MFQFIVTEMCLYFQIPICTAEELDCASKVKINDAECLQQCSGILVTSYDQDELEERSNIGFKNLAEYLSQKDLYGGLTNMAEEFQGFMNKIDCFHD